VGPAVEEYGLAGAGGSGGGGGRAGVVGWGGHVKARESTVGLGVEWGEGKGTGLVAAGSRGGGGGGGGWREEGNGCHVCVGMGSECN